MVSGVVLPTEHFSNVTVTNGKCISECENQIAVGVAMPGLRESLNLEDGADELQDIELPESVEVEADVENFELEMTMTL